MKKLKQQSGAALLAILAVVLLGIAVTTISAISINAMRDKANKKSTAVLQEARKALLGYALTSSPPGQLPCPDNNGDGVEDISGVNCIVQLGRLPWRTLGLPELRDGYNSHLWYAFNQNLRATSSFKKNSSTITTLNLDATPLAAIVIAPNRALTTQNRNNNSPISDYLEGVNADANTNNFSRVVDDQHNDILLSLENQDYWSLMEESLLKRMATILNQYHAVCGFYPWAASFGMAPYNSLDTLQQGNIPVDSALPVNWNSGCAGGIVPPVWFSSEWGREIYYAMCTPAEGDCLSISGDTTSNSAALLIAPGVRLGGQLRPTSSLNNYYENANAILDNNFFMQFNKNLNGSFNDVLLTLSP